MEFGLDRMGMVGDVMVTNKGPFAGNGSERMSIVGWDIVERDSSGYHLIKFEDDNDTIWGIAQGDRVVGIGWERSKVELVWRALVRKKSA